MEDQEEIVINPPPTPQQFSYINHAPSIFIYINDGDLKFNMLKNKKKIVLEINHTLMLIFIFSVFKKLMDGNI